MKNKILFLVYIVIVIFCLCSCSDKKYLEKAAKLSNEMTVSADCRVTVIVPVSKIIYNKNALTMKVGETYTPSFSFSPDNASNTALTFETSNPDVATVENGTITAHNSGNVKITATTTDGSNKKAVISIKVVSTFSGEFVTFNPKMMKSVSSQISEATDFTINVNNRAILAALLTLEYQYQCPNKIIDFTKPILVSKSGTRIYYANIYKLYLIPPLYNRSYHLSIIS